MLKILVLILLMIGFVSSAEVDFNCPDKIYAGEEFECLVSVFDGNGVYDIKIDLERVLSGHDSGEPERNSALRVWNGNAWKSGYYYLINFIEDGDTKNVRLNISEAGHYSGILKLRQGKEREDFDIGKISVEKEFVESKTQESKNESSVVVEEVNVNEIVSSGEGNKIIVLGGGNAISIRNDSSDSDGERWDYVSKDGKIVDWLPYGFCLFLIFLIGIMIWYQSA